MAARFTNFQQAAGSRGLLEPFHQDGKPHRCHVAGDHAGRKSGWYIWRPDNSGLICNWKDGLGNECFFPRGQSLTSAERYARSERIRIDQKTFEQERAACHEEARLKAAQIWAASRPFFIPQRTPLPMLKTLKIGFWGKII